MRRPLVLGLILCTAGTLPAADLADDWAFKPVQRPPVPAANAAARTAVDAFLLQRLEAGGLSYRPAANKATLIRRVTFDLTGLPPPAADVAAFEADDSPRSFERVVDRLLASPAYGERQALPWLDVVRFAETDGFKADDRRTNTWRYRDYVIATLSAEKRVLRFIEEKLTGRAVGPDTL